MLIRHALALLKIHRFLSVSKPRRTDALEAWSALTTLSWGLVLALPGDTFATTRAYSVLASWGGEPAWMAFCFSVASIQVLGLSTSWLLGGRELRIIGSLAGGAFWALLGWLLFRGNPIGHGWVLYTALSVGLLLTSSYLIRDKS